MVLGYAADSCWIKKGLRMKYKFKFYLFNVSLNCLRVAVYESKYDYELRVEKNGNEPEDFIRHFFLKKFMNGESISEKSAALFCTNEDDIYHNESRALSDVLEGLSKNSEQAAKIRQLRCSFLPLLQEKS